MEQKNTFLIGGGLVAVLLLFFVLTNDGCKKRNFSWRETYAPESKEPYGAYIFYELLRETQTEENFTLVKDSLNKVLPQNQTSGEKADYVFLGAAMLLDSADVQSLLSFVHDGNNAFISSKTIPYNLMSYLYEECDDELYWSDYDQQRDSTARFNFINKNLQVDSSFLFKYYKRFSPAKYNWSYFDPDIFCYDSNWAQLGTMDDIYPNFVRIPHGNGYFYLHTTPLAFSNFSLNEEENLAYSEKTLAYLDGEKTYYDSYNVVSEGVGRRRNQELDFFSKRTFNQENELSYILSQPALRWAWYLTLALVLLYLIFRAKREQRIIPVLEKNRNTSLEFVSTIGQLYFQQNNHQQLAAKKMKLWLGFIRDKYRLNFKEEAQDDFVKRLAVKSDIAPALIETILSKNKLIQSATGIQEHSLIEFHQVMDQFYQECK